MLDFEKPQCSLHGLEMEHRDDGGLYCLKCVGGKLYSYLKGMEN